MALLNLSVARAILAQHTIVEGSCCVATISSSVLHRSRLHVGIECLLELLDRQADIEGVGVTLEITRTRLAGIYFEDKGSTLRCPATDRTYPAALIDDIVEIRSAHR